MSPLELAQLMAPPEVKRFDPWQVELLTGDAVENILLIHRQAGKSLAVAIKALVVALTEPGSLVLLVSRSYRQSLELARKVRQSLTAYQDNLQKRHPELDVDLGLLTDMKAEFELPNGSRVVSLPPNPDTIRGYSKPRIVIIDEASRVSDDVYFTIRPMRLAAPRWQLYLPSTPFGQRGFFWREWRNPGFKKWRHAIDDSLTLGRVTPAFVEGERRKGDLYFRQEYGCEFLGGVQTLFSRTELENALIDEPPLEELYECISQI